MNTAQERRLQKLEERHHDRITIRLCREGPWPDPIEVRFVKAKPEPEEPPPSESL